MSKKFYLLSFLISVITIVGTLFGASSDAFAATTITISPLHQNKVLVPGKTEYGSFTISNPADNNEALEFELYIKPFSITNENEVNFEEKDNYSQITNWISLDTENGTIFPNESIDVGFSISVPENAPAGGQYATIIVRAKPTEGEIITEIYEMAHLIYTEVAGETIRHGEISDVDVPSFLTSGNISGSATITNTGNVHSNVVHTLKIFPIFSNEEVFTNEENPQSNLIMPGATRMTSVTWDKTPSIGIFHVIYAVEYEGTKSEVDKMVIVCPLWLLFLILLALFLLIFKIFWGKKKDKK